MAIARWDPELIATVKDVLDRGLQRMLAGLSVDPAAHDAVRVDEHGLRDAENAVSVGHRTVRVLEESRERDAKLPDEARGVPTTLFNGKPEASGGGPMAMAEEQYKQYRQVIDPLLETNSAAKLSASAVQQDNKINIKVEVTDLKKHFPVHKGVFSRVSGMT